MSEIISVASKTLLLAQWITTYTNGVMYIFDGTQPTDAEEDESGYTTLAIITESGGAFTPGSASNGLNFEASAGKLAIASGEDWEGTGLAAGLAGWFRFYDNDRDQGADGGDAYYRFDGRISTSGAELNLNSRTIAVGSPIVISSFSFDILAGS